MKTTEELVEVDASSHQGFLGRKFRDGDNGPRQGFRFQRDRDTALSSPANRNFVGVDGLDSGQRDSFLEAVRVRCGLYFNYVSHGWGLSVAGPCWTVQPGSGSV